MQYIVGDVNSWCSCLGCHYGVAVSDEDAVASVRIDGGFITPSSSVPTILTPQPPQVLRWLLCYCPPPQFIFPNTNTGPGWLLLWLTVAFGSSVDQLQVQVMLSVSRKVSLPFTTVLYTLWRTDLENLYTLFDIFNTSLLSPKASEHR